MGFRQSTLPPHTGSAANLYAPEQVRELDRRAIQEQGIAGISLMKRAGQAIFGQIVNRWPDIGHLTVFCGPGNNGGDGYIVAGLAARERLPVMLIEIAPEKVKGDAERARNFALDHGVEPILADNWLSSPTFAETSLIVDALLGTGFSGTLRAPVAELIKRINQSGLPVVSADIPSGLEADTGYVGSDAVRADCTVTFIGNKPGVYTGQGRAFAGDIIFDDLGVPEVIYSNIAPVARILNLETELESLKPRAADAHKGKNGHLLIIGGDLGFAGAPLMVAEAALRMGAGLVSIATRPEHIPACVSRRPEIMALDAQGAQFDQVLDKASHLVVGPGLGTEAWGQRLMQRAMESGKPMVLDADALNLVARDIPRSATLNEQSVITPHPGEAGRLLGKSAQEVGRNRLKAVADLIDQYSATVLLKGSGTLIGSALKTGSDSISLCPYGNPGMASGGMGDVLSGIIGGLMAQGLTAEQSARLGSCLHARSADILAASHGQRGLLATDLIDQARALLNGVDL